MNRKTIMVFFLFFLIYGMFSASAYADGYLWVSIEPVELCYNNNAQWRVDKGVWYTCNTWQIKIPEGNHTVEFKDIEGWRTPAQVTVNITTGETTHITGEYISYTNGIANTYFAASGFDTNGDRQPDIVDTGEEKLFAVELPDNPGVYLQSDVGGMAAPMAYYPDVKESLYKDGMKELTGGLNITFEQPEKKSALEYRYLLYHKDGVSRLEAFFKEAGNSFLLKLEALLTAEERFREALRVDPYYIDALNGLLETYYARAEGFMMIGNDYMAKAYKHKYEPNQDKSESIVDMETKDIGSALICYEVGFREFMKLFNPEFVGVGEVRKKHLDIEAETLFFTRRFKNPNNPYGEDVSFESLRGQTNAIGVSSFAFYDEEKPVGPLQGSPTKELEIFNSGTLSPKDQTVAAIKRRLSTERLSANDKEWNTVDAPIKFYPLVIEGESSHGNTIECTFSVEIKPENPVKKLGVVIEFDESRLIPLGDGKVDFSDSAFSKNPKMYKPGEMYGGVTLYGNQLLIIGESDSPVSKTKLFAKVPFKITSDTQKAGTCYIYASGSGGSLHSGYKDVAILYRLAAAHANATAEKVKRIYNVGSHENTEQCISFIQEEVDLIGGWFEHIQRLLEQSASNEDLKSIDKLQSAINEVAAVLGGLSSLREFIKSGANSYGYRDDYVPFYNFGNKDTFDAIRELVVGDGSFTGENAQGFFGQARNAETDAIAVYKELLDTKDRIRSELFTINQQLETRLVQICGRIDADGNPGNSLKDDIDYEMHASPRNSACEIGQKVLLLERTRAVLEQAKEDYNQFEADIELKRKTLDDEVSERKKVIPKIIEEYAGYDSNLTKEISKISGQQHISNAWVQGLATMAQNGWKDWIEGKSLPLLIAGSLQIANGYVQAHLEEQKGELEAEKIRLGAEERIKLADAETEIMKIKEAADIEMMVNDQAVKQAAIRIAEIDIQVALGQLNQLINERDELLAKRGSQIANLGEMSFADPSFRLTQFNTMKEASARLEYLKGWLYVMTRALYYKWALKDDYKFKVNKNPPAQVNINDIDRLQVVGVANNDKVDPLWDTVTAFDYINALLIYNDTQPIFKGSSPTKIDWDATNNTGRYSIREDYLRIVRHEDTYEESQRVREEFKAWLKSPERFDKDGNLIIEFDTMGHMSGYDVPVSKNNNVWTNFALRTFHPQKPIWNNKIETIGVALSSVIGPFKGDKNISGSIEYGGIGYVKRNSCNLDDLQVYQMRQWLYSSGPTELEPVLSPIDVRIVDLLKIVDSAAFEVNVGTYMLSDLKERPVASTLWRLVIPKDQAERLILDNIDDIFIYINSTAYQTQSCNE